MVGTVAGFLDDAELGGLGDEGSGAVEAVELLAAVVELVKEVVGGDGLPWLNDLADDIAQGTVLHEAVVLGLVHGFDDFVWEIVIDGEMELCIESGLRDKTLDEFDRRDGMLCRDGEDVSGFGKEHAAEVACR